jgi:hypothetical protein
VVEGAVVALALVVALGELEGEGEGEADCVGVVEGHGDGVMESVPLPVVQPLGSISIRTGLYKFFKSNTFVAGIRCDSQPPPPPYLYGSFIKSSDHHVWIKTSGIPLGLSSVS